MKIIKLIFFISITAFVISFFQIGKLPNRSEILNELKKDPLQTKTQTQSFETEKNGIVYVVEPIYNYELNGLIVSYHHSSSLFDYYHKKWEDYLNIKDICVIWDENIETGIYEKMKFKNKSYSCWTEFKTGTTQKDWTKFKNENLSNNHLLSNNKKIDKKILDAKNGDQVYLKGYLVNYSIKNGTFSRKSSTTRTDTAMGACETIFVEDFQILKKANTDWRNIHEISKYLLVGSFIILIVSFFKNP